MFATTVSGSRADILELLRSLAAQRMGGGIEGESVAFNMEGAVVKVRKGMGKKGVVNSGLSWWGGRGVGRVVVRVNHCMLSWVAN